MTSPAHVSAVGALLALAFTGAVLVLLWGLRVYWVSADAIGPRQLLGGARVILVPITAAGDSQRRVELACRLAEEQHAALLLVYVIEVAWTLPLDAALDQEDQKARAALDAAREITARWHLPVRTVIRRARVARDGIAEAARYHHVDMVFREPDAREGRWHHGWGRPVAR